MMTVSDRFIESVKKSTNLWIVLWVLLLLNLLIVFILIKGISWIVNVLFVLLLAAGIAALLRMAHFTPSSFRDLQA